LSVEWTGEVPRPVNVSSEEAQNKADRGVSLAMKAQVSVEAFTGRLGKARLVACRSDLTARSIRSLSAPSAGYVHSASLQRQTGA
jgi:hypothetical protein